MAASIMIRKLAQAILFASVLPLSGWAQTPSETGWTTVSTVRLDNNLQKVTVIVAENVTSCPAGFEFAYSPTTLSAHYYSSLMAAKLSSLSVKVYYTVASEVCTLSQLDLRD